VVALSHAYNNGEAPPDGLTPLQGKDAKKRRLAQGKKKIMTWGTTSFIYACDGGYEGERRR